MRKPHRTVAGEALLGSTPFCLTGLALPPSVGSTLPLLGDHQVHGPESASPPEKHRKLLRDIDQRPGIKDNQLIDVVS